MCTSVFITNTPDLCLRLSPDLLAPLFPLPENCSLLSAQGWDKASTLKCPQRGAGRVFATKNGKSEVSEVSLARSRAGILNSRTFRERPGSWLSLPAGERQETAALPQDHSFLLCLRYTHSRVLLSLGSSSFTPEGARCSTQDFY